MPVNPWLEQKVKKLHSPPTIDTLIEVRDPQQVQLIRQQLGATPGIRVGGTAFNYIEAKMPHQLVDRVGQVPGVTVHYNAPKTIRSPLSIADPLLGKFSISSIEIPYTPAQMATRFGLTLPNRLRTPPAALFGLLPKTAQQALATAAPKNPDVIIIPTGETRKLLGVPENNKMKNTRVCVLDTGIGWPDPFLLHMTKGDIYMDATIEQPNPLDGLGHGHWCITCAFGDTYTTRYGDCRGVADPENGTLGSVKCLSTVGFGTSFSVISAMEKAYKWGAKVVSMSLGGELQGSVDEDPECKVVKQLSDKMIFVIAAGNEGPEPWTIGSPGASPFVVTVGAWSPYYDGLAIFSSRGPNAAWYKEHHAEWIRDQEAYGSRMMKPDVVAPGGGPVRAGDIPDMIYSGVRGWCDGMNDLTPGDGFDAMRGCVGEGSLVYTPDGPIPIENVLPGQMVYTFDEEGSISPREVLGAIPQGKREVFKVSAKGFSLPVTDNHPLLLIPKGSDRPEFVQTCDMRDGDAVVLTKRMPARIAPELDELITAETARFLGFFMGDGWLSTKHRNNAVCLADSTNPVKQAYQQLFEELFSEKLRDGGSWKYCYSRKLALTLELLGFGHKHKEIPLPEWVFHLSEEKRQAFLAGIIQADGTPTHSGAATRRSLELASEAAISGLHALARYSNVRVGERTSRSRNVRAPHQVSDEPSISHCINLNYAVYEDGVSAITKRRITGVDPAYYFVKKVKVEPLGEMETWDLSIEGTRNFLTEGFIAHNTSMATPAAAGLISLAVDRGYIKTADDVKQRMSTGAGSKSPLTGYGMITWRRLTGG